MRIVVLGLSISSSWGNGHATTWRALGRGLAALGHELLFLERDVPWYAEQRDLARPGFCDLVLYEGVDALRGRLGPEIERADAVILGSYVPDGIEVAELVLQRARGVRAFYDIDTPITVEALEGERCAYLSAGQVSAFDLYLSFSGGRLLEHLSRRFGAKRPHALYCAVDETRYHPVRVETRWDLGYLGTYSEDRQPTLDRLLLEPARRMPTRRFVVAGPQYPAGINWPENVERIDHLPPDEHSAFYGAQRFTLNVTRASMIRAGWSPSVRLFEAAACGTAILSDRWDGLSDLLPEGEAIHILDESRAVDEVLASDDSARHRLGAAARQIVLARHTGVARARELVALLAACRSSPDEVTGLASLG